MKIRIIKIWMISNMVLSLLLLIGCSKKSTTPTPPPPVIDTRTAPTVIKKGVSNITTTTVTILGEITSDGGTPITSCYTSWSKSRDFTVENKVNHPLVVGAFSTPLTGFAAGAKIFFKHTAVNAKGTSATTIDTTYTLPTVTTGTAGSITATSAVISGNSVITEDPAVVAYRGVCWNTTGSPTISSSKTVEGKDVGSFASTLNGLNASTTYKCRSYSVNPDSVVTYGSEISFTTKAPGFTIGQIYGGGKIFYIFNGGTEAYVVDTVPLAEKYAWGARNILLGNTGTAFGTGPSNTTNIVSGFTSGPSAAKLCDTSTRGGFTDWFLGSKDEWPFLIQNRWQVGITIESANWTSSEFDAQLAWVQSWNGSQGKTDKMDGNFPLFGAPTVLAFRKVHL